MSKTSTKDRQFAEEQLDLLLQEHCEELAYESTPPSLSDLAMRLQMFVNAGDRALEKPPQTRIGQQAWQDYDLSIWDAPAYHS